MRLFFFIPVLIFAFAIISSCHADDIRDFFEWGEYDSLISVLETALASDSVVGLHEATIAEYHCYLGVAYFAVGKIAEARTEFIRALKNNPQLNIEQKYTTLEMQNLFDATKNELADLESKKVNMPDSSEYAQNAISTQLNQQASISKPRLVFALASYGLASLAGALTYYNYSQGSDEYNEYSKAAKEGNRAEYEKLKRSLTKRNTIIAAGEATAAVFGLTGIVLSFNLK